jgi:hypothetical protein
MTDAKKVVILCGPTQYWTELSKTYKKQGMIWSSISLFTWGVNEFLFLGGLVLGVGLLVVGEAILISILLFKQKNWVQHDNKTFN